MAFRMVKQVKSIIVTEATVRSPFNAYSSQNSRYGGDKDKKEMISVDVLTIKLNMCYVFSMRTRNSTQDFIKSKNICITKKNLCWDQPRLESQKLAVEKGTHQLLSLYICHFLLFRFSKGVPGLQTDPALILLGAMESTTVTSHKSCLATALGTSVKQSDRF